MKTEAPTLIILTPGFAKDETDTTCLPLQQNLVRSLKSNYPELQIIIVSFQYPYCEKTYRWFGNTVVSFGGENKGGISKLLLRQKIYKALKNINKENRIIGLLSFWYGECALVGKRFTDKNNLKHFCWLLGQDAKLDNLYPQKTHLKASELIALSDFLQDEFENNHGIKPQHIIPPGIDANEFDGNFQNKDIDILAAGSLIPLKQYDIFVDVIGAIKKQFPVIKAKLVGDGPEKNKLQGHIADSEMQSNITLTGELTHPATLQTMQKAKIFLHPSSYEGFGVVMVEALYAGCHVISFCKPMKTAIKNWHIVNTKEEMAQKAAELLKNDGLQFENVFPFSINDVAKKMMALFDQDRKIIQPE